MDHAPHGAWRFSIGSPLAYVARSPSRHFLLPFYLERLWETQAHITRDCSITAV